MPACIAGEPRGGEVGASCRLLDNTISGEAYRNARASPQLWVMNSRAARAETQNVKCR